MKNFWANMKLLCILFLLFIENGFAATILSLKEERRRNDQWPWTDIDKGLESYVSRPDLKPLKLNITTYDASLISPGYWFISPYDKRIVKTRRHTFVPGQIGPHIYDNKGELVWSGSLAFKQRNAHDFRVVKYNGEDALSFVELRDGSAKSGMKKSSGLILNSTYEIANVVKANNGMSGLNMHEFNVVDDGKRALVITTRKQYANESDINGSEWDGQLLQSYGFQEVDVETGRTLFEWWAVDHVPVSHTQIKGHRKKLDFFHLNSVDKDADGNYLISSRHTSTIYLISRVDGSIIWRLGGSHSSFVQENHFNFSSQHHARIHSQNSTHTVISFLDNASDRKLITAECSSALLVSLSTATNPMTASVIKQWTRPDRELSHLRGSVQFLPNSNVFVGWSSYGYTSEFTYEGQLLQEVRFPTFRFEDYRAYKFNFAGFSNEPVALVSRAYGATPETTTTAVYVSWNGATEVAAWNVYSSENEDGSGTVSLLATAEKDRFETVVMLPGHHQFVFAEAISKTRTSMKNSSITMTDTTASSSRINFPGYIETAGSQNPKNGHAWTVKDWVFAFVAVALIIVVWFAVWIKSRTKAHRNQGWQRVDIEDQESDALSIQTSGSDDLSQSFLPEEAEVASEVDLGSGSDSLDKPLDFQAVSNEKI